MEGLSGKELEDSIFGTSLHLDWAEETDSLDPLASRSYASAGQKSNEPAASSARPRQGSPPTSAVNDARHRGSRDNSAREPRAGRRQQQGDRQTRQDSRPPKPSIVDTGNRSGGGSGARGGSSSRVRSGRSASRVGGAGAMAQQQQQQPAYSQSPGGINIRNARGARDRSRSLERAGGLDQGRSWRGSSSAGRPRAEAVDRWEHDKFDAPFSAPSTRAPLSAEVVAADIGHIGKEGISHVTINRRGSNASSSRGHLGSSYEAPRRYPLDPDAVHAPDQPAGSAEPVRKAVNEPYRAPHRRRSSADNTAPPPHKPILPAATSPIPSPVPEEPAQVKPADEAAANDDGSSAEMEWENFVANGGLDMPIDRITDDLLKHPRSRSQSLVSQKETRVVLATSAPESQRPSPLSRDIGGGRTMAHDRAALLLSNDGDEDEDDASDHAGRSDSLYEKSECEGRGLAAREAAIRGSASTQQAVATASASAVSSLESNMASLVLEQVVTQRARRPSAPASERSMAQTAVTVAAHQQLPLDANPLGIQIKGLSAKPAISSAPTPAVNGRSPAPADARSSHRRHPPPPRPDPVASSAKSPTIPPKPAAPVAPAARPTTPPRASRPASRSSSAEGQVQGATPTSYLRRQFEVYDEDRGRHIFSVNIPYDNNRFAPIHVHEKDDLPKIAAKFARTWRVHNKEHRIKQLLIKMKSLMIDSSL